MVFIYGLLEKRGGFGLWRSRFFVLKGCTLSYFLKKGDNDPKRVLQINGDCSISKGATLSDGFTLQIGEKDLRLRADDNKAGDEWFSTLKRMIKDEKERSSEKPQREGTKLWWAETKQGQFCFELDHFYEMRKTIGSGGYGVVISALNTKTNSKVAVKKVVSAFDDVLVAKRMTREVRLLRQFDHDHVIKIVDILPPPSVENFQDVYIVMERMDTDLHHIIYSGQALKEGHIQFFLYQLLCGIEYIHRCGVIHRDLKPANILVNTNCQLKLCDFGLARSFDCPDELGETAKFTEYVVTRWWRAPEVFLEAEYGPAIDVWSAGCILAEMFQKVPLFMGSNTAQMLRLIVGTCGKPQEADLDFVTNRKARAYMLDITDKPKVELREKFPDVHENAVELLGKMIAFNPSKRLSLKDAIQHPWLDRFNSRPRLLTEPEPLQLAKVEATPLVKACLQELLFEDVVAFRPEAAARR